MAKKDIISIKSALHKEISTNVVINKKKYLILTEEIDPKEHLITTKVYLGGKIVLTKTLDCRNIPKTPDYEKKMTELIYRQHEMIVGMLRKENIKKVKSPSQYLDEVKTMLQRKSNRSALELLTHALKKYSDDPFLLSYYGCLEAIINKNFTDGIDNCSRAIEILDEKIPFGQEIFYPTFYLNLGRAYLAAKDKKGATEVFQKGLSFDKENKDLVWEMKKLGERRKPLIPYLRRSNPINKYIGMILHTLKKESL